jgi:hypothetical protein
MPHCFSTGEGVAEGPRAGTVLAGTRFFNVDPATET